MLSVTLSTGVDSAAFGVYPVIAGDLTAGKSSVELALVQGVYVITHVTSSFVAVRLKVIEAVASGSAVLPSLYT